MVRNFRYLHAMNKKFWMGQILCAKKVYTFLQIWSHVFYKYIHFCRSFASQLCSYIEVLIMCIQLWNLEIWNLDFEAGNFAGGGFRILQWFSGVVGPLRFTWGARDIHCMCCKIIASFLRIKMHEHDSKTEIWGGGVKRDAGVDEKQLQVILSLRLWECN